MSRNQHRVAQHGREPGLELERGGERVALLDWGRALLRDCAPIAAALDAAGRGGTRAHGDAAGATPHRDALASAEAALSDPSITPSARTLREMAQQHDNSFPHFALARSRQHREALLAMPLGAEAQARLARMAEESLEAQRRIEQTDDMPFETYRQRYLAGELPRPDAR